MCGRKTLISAIPSAIPLCTLANFGAWRVVSRASALADAMADAPGKRHGIDDLLGVMARLRDPETGCPWDVEQNFGTIAPYTIEEAYEVADAITAKMIRRHPHVFADPTLREAFLATPMWDRIKAEEKATRGDAARGDAGQGSLLDDVPVALPALTRAVKLQKRAAQVGFDWPSVAPVLAKAEEEIAELKAAIVAGGSGAGGRASAAVKEEFGDLLFVMANLARHLKLDPEAALRDANAKFARRFGKIEAALAREGRNPQDATLEEMDQLWDEAKAAETHQ